MALIKCPECKKKISDQCGKCPNCGYPIEISETPIESLDNEVAETEFAVEEKTDNSKKERKPINKKLLIGIISAVVVVFITVGGILGYNALLPRINATKDFKAAVKFVEQKNIELETEIVQSEELIAKKQPLLDETLVSTLENAISDAKAVKITDFKTPKKIEDIISRTEELNKTDYSEAIANLNDKHAALEINAKRYQLVSAPTEAYVIKCLKTIPEITGISAVTEDNDPNGNLNKAGGYTSTVYFSHEKLKLDKFIYGDTLIEQGTDAGGAIEVYSCVEDATKRRDYLATFDGSVFASGTHTVIGTVLVRTSDKLTASQQKDLEAKIIAALTYIEEADGKQEIISSQNKETSNKHNNSSNTKSLTTSQISKPKNRNQEAIVEAVNQAKEWFPTDRHFIENLLINPSLEQDFDAFTEDEAAYAIKNANIDWKKHALENFNDFLNNNAEYVKTYTPDDLKSDLQDLANEGFTEKEILYVQNNCNIDFNAIALSIIRNELTESPPETTQYTPRSLRDTLYGFSDAQKNYAMNNCDINWNAEAVELAEMLDLNLPYWSSEYEDGQITKGEMIKELIKEGFTESQANFGVNNCTIDWESRIHD